MTIFTAMFVCAIPETSDDVVGISSSMTSSIRISTGCQEYTSDILLTYAMHHLLMFLYNIPCVRVFLFLYPKSYDEYIVYIMK